MNITDYEGKERIPLEDILFDNSDLEDQWYYASQKENNAYAEYQQRYRLKDIYLSRLVADALDDPDIKTNAAAERVVKSSKEYERFIKEMVFWDYTWKRRKTEAEIIKMKYFENKSSVKAENDSYGPNTQDKYYKGGMIREEN